MNQNSKKKALNRCLFYFTPAPSFFPSLQGVAYNPTWDRYYACEAGNPTFKCGTHDGNGTRLQTVTAGWDLRNLWWNAKVSQLQGNL